MAQLKEMNLKILVKEERLKKYWDKVNQYKQNRIFQNNKSKFYQQVNGESTMTNQQLDPKETKQFWSKIWKQKDYNRNAEWIDNIKKWLELKEGAKVNKL